MDRLRTPDTPVIVPRTEYLVFPFPAIPDLQAAFIGAILGVAFWTSWEQVGTMTIEEAAGYFKDALNLRYTMTWHIGMIVAHAAEDLPARTLLCDGSTHSQDDYPELYDILPAGLISGSDFVTPDLRDKFVIGSGSAYPTLDEGGEAEHTLTVGEMPSHSHSYSAAQTLVDAVGAVPEPSAIAVPFSNTGSAGGDEAHNNMPPYYSLRYIIIAK